MPFPFGYFGQTDSEYDPEFDDLECEPETDLLTENPEDYVLDYECWDEESLQDWLAGDPDRRK